MNFLGLGPGELVLIAILGLIVFGPGKLPEIANQIGRVVRDFRRSTSDISSEFQRSFSLDEPPSKEPKAPAAESASNGAGTTTVPETQAVQTASEPPLADTREWHWEDSSPPQPVTAAASYANDSVWQWDESRETESPAPVTEAAVSQAALPTPAADGRLWQWDEAQEPASSSKPRRASKSRRRKKDE